MPGSKPARRPQKRPPAPRRLLHGIRREAQFIYKDSIIHRYLGWVRIGRFHPFDDGVQALQPSPLGTFFYNQRALVFFSSGLVLVLLAVLDRAAHPGAPVHRSLQVLFWFWIGGVVATLVLHRPFRRAIESWSNSTGMEKAPGIFDHYFVLDSFLILVLVLAGRMTSLNLDAFAFLVFANTFVYAAYARSGYEQRRGVTVAVFTLALFTLALLATTTAAGSRFPATWFDRSLVLAPLVGMLLITLFSIMVISWLRTSEHAITRSYLELLGTYEHALSGPDLSLAGGSWEHDQARFNERQFLEQVRGLMRDLCQQGSPFWYSSAVLWLAEDHQDRGRVYLPGAHFNSSDHKEAIDGIDASTGFLNIDRCRLVASLRFNVQPSKAEIAIWRFQVERDIPAALIPLDRNQARVGVLALYGSKSGPSLQRHDEAFLSSLGAIIANTMEQWEGRFRAFPQKEMDNLFSCTSLEEVFPKAAEILQRYLFAEGCMVLFRPDPKALPMKAVAARNFDRFQQFVYRVGVGLTGCCALEQRVIRIDNVPAHRDEFDPGLLRRLEKAHGQLVRSWMAVPIGTKGQRNYGVIKVINSRFRCGWFTQYDERIGEDLALRLQVIIERFLHIQHVQDASEQATKSAEAAEAARRRAEETARQRQQDLMNVTHQIQGPLIAVVGTLTGIKPDGLGRPLQTRIEHAQALVEDTLALAYGTLTILAREAGRNTAFRAEEIDGPVELERLARRLQMTNSREEDLKFSFYKEPGFPKLRLDRKVFISVMFSLIHNTMKYADPESVVTLECSFERRTGEAALKVKSRGEPIEPSEKEEIFLKFRRGRNVEQGRHHGGVGLGLWVARELMKAIGGNLTVELDPQDRRFAVFIVHLPGEHRTA